MRQIYQNTFLSRKNAVRRKELIFFGFLLLSLICCLPVYGAEPEWPAAGEVDATEWIILVDHDAVFEAWRIWLDDTPNTIPCSGASTATLQNYYWDGDSWETLNFGGWLGTCVSNYIDFYEGYNYIQIADENLEALGDSFYVKGQLVFGAGGGSNIVFTRTYWDYSTQELLLEEAPTEPTVWGEEPASETEITSLTEVLTIGYEGLDDYDSLYVYFRHLLTGLTTSGVVFEVSDLEGGEQEITLSDFDFTKNGNWTLQAVASYESYIVQDGMFLSGYGSQFTENLTDGNYFLDINIEGFEDVFLMSDFDSWYSENITRFDSPTDMIAGLTGFLSPIFSYIGEFGGRIKDYFNTADAYARGYDIGRAIPVFSYYISQVAVFFGGFPIMSTFFIVLLLMVGVFIFKLVIRFIPHFGS